MTTSGISKERRIDVKLLKYELHNTLQRKGRGNWKKYWCVLQQFLLSDLCLEEMQAEINGLLTNDERTSTARCIIFSN